MRLHSLHEIIRRRQPMHSIQDLGDQLAYQVPYRLANNPAKRRNRIYDASVRQLAGTTDYMRPIGEQS